MEVRHYQRFAELVKAIRKKHGLSQRALAKRLRVSPGYVGQWELKLSQPSPQVALELCRQFAIDDVEYVQRLAFASRAPDWLRESIVKYERRPESPGTLNALEKRIVEAARRLSARQLEKLTERVEGWVDAILQPADD